MDGTERGYKIQEIVLLSTTNTFHLFILFNAPLTYALGLLNEGAVKAGFSRGGRDPGTKGEEMTLGAVNAGFSAGVESLNTWIDELNGLFD